MARILVVGGSLGGLLAANLLLRDGHDVTLLEKAAGSLDGRGAGIITHPALIDALRRAGATVDASLGVWVEERRVLGADGSVVTRMPLAQLLTSWSRLYALLLAAFPAERYRQGVAVTRVEDCGDGVRAHAEGGAVFEAELLIASDGIRSAVRAQLLPDALPCYAGYVAWRGVCDEGVLSAATRASMFEHFCFGLPPGEQMLGYPVAGAGNATGRGQRRYNFVWYRAADAAGALRALMTDAQGVHHPHGIAPHKIAPHHVAAMRTDAHRLLAPQFAEVLDRTVQPFLQPIHDVESARLAFGRVALMGDAGFVARPHVGMGVTKAAEDACAIADAIRTHGANAAALQAYEAQRLPAARRVLQRARELGAYMQSQGRERGSLSGNVCSNVERDARSVLELTAIDPASLPLATA